MREHAQRVVYESYLEQCRAKFFTRVYLTCSCAWVYVMYVMLCVHVFRSVRVSILD